MHKEVSEEVQQLLRTVYEFCESEDRSVRERQIRQWRQLKLLWEGFSQIWYNEVAHDWRIWDEHSNQDGNNDQAYYDRPINVFQAYLQSIIAALSIIVPPIKCFPDDADDTLDLATARAGDKIAQLVYRHSDVGLLWLHALFINCTEGMVAFYSYPRSDKEYGTYKKDYEEDVEEEHELTTCSLCGHTISDNVVPPGFPSPLVGTDSQVQEPPIAHEGPNNQLNLGPQLSEPITSEQELNEYIPDDEDAALHHELLEGNDLCPSCMQMMDPAITREKFVTTRLVNSTLEPKTRICLEAYGGLNTKIPNYAKCQKDIPYLIYSKESNYVMIVEKHKHLHGKKELLESLKNQSTAGAYNQYDQWGRLSPQYQGEYPINVITESCAWLRPAAFNCLPEKDDIKKLNKLFPDGVKVTYANDCFADAENEALDDCWTLTENPLSDHLHFAPDGSLLTSVQEITNDVISLVLQTIEHGIGQTAADPAVLDFNAYEQMEVLPGGIFPTKQLSGKNISEGFYQFKTATLSQEVMPFFQQIQSLGQLTSGALPSLFGGAIEGSETASQYSMSRAQATQRLQNKWKLFTTTWKRVFSKVVPMYIKEVQYDEKDVERDKDGNFVNVLIRKAELEGKIGKVELEANENLPLTWGQKKDLLEKLLMNQNPVIQQLVSAPENLALLHEALGLVDFYVPGEDDIIKQYDEIKLLLNSEPIMVPPDEMMAMEAAANGLPPPEPVEESSVPIDPIFDNNQLEFEICRKWIISEAGRQAKTENEAGYRNVLLHGKMHNDIMKQQQMEQQMSMAAASAPPKKPNAVTAKEAPITEEANVETI